MRLSLAHLSIMDATHAELATIAAGLACSHICVFVKGAHVLPDSFPSIDTAKSARELRLRMDATGLSVGTLEAFVCHPQFEPADYAGMLEIAALLGAHRITAINLHPEPAGAVDRLTAFCELSAKYRLTVGLEWYRFSETKSLSAALELVRRVHQPNLKLTVDILHLLRNGGQPADLAAVDPRLIDYAQISDGPLEQPDERQQDEATENRGFPGEGEFPLVSFIRHLPPEVLLSVEAPANRLRGSLSAAERAERAITGTRRVLAAAGR